MVQVYISTAYPTITGGDSGELISAAFLLVHTLSCFLSRPLSYAALAAGCCGEFDEPGMWQGVAHPPGYPLFTMLAAIGASQSFWNESLRIDF